MAKNEKEEEIRRVSNLIGDRDGDEALSRPAVQAFLKDRASEEGREPKAAADETGARIVAEVKSERRASRAAARARGQVSEGISLPDDVIGMLVHSLKDIETGIRQALGEERQRGTAEMRRRVETVEHEAAAQRAVLEADLLLANREIATLAGDLDDARERSEGFEAELN